MIALNIQLSETLNEQLQAHVEAGGFRDASDYLEKLIRADQENREAVQPYLKNQVAEALVLDGIESGDAGPMTSADWEQLKQPFRDRQDAAHQ